MQCLSRRLGSWAVSQRIDTRQDRRPDYIDNMFCVLHTYVGTRRGYTDMFCALHTYVGTRRSYININSVLCIVMWELAEATLICSVRNIVMWGLYTVSWRF